MKFPGFETGANILNGLIKFNEKAARIGETGSSNFHATARGLGLLAASMANGGSLKGKTILSPEAFEALHSTPTVEQEPIWDNRTIFTQGGL